MNDVDRQKRILLIDDDFELLELLNRYLSSGGYESALASSGQVGLWLAESVLPDLIFLDIQMPDMDGFEVSRKLRENQNLAHIPVVFLSAHSGEENKSKAFSVGGADFLSKPVSKQNLLETVRTYLVKAEKWSELKKTEDTKPAPQEDKPGKKEGGNSFLSFLKNNNTLDKPMRDRINHLSPTHIYEELAGVGIPSEKTARLLAEFSGLEYVSTIKPDSVALGLLPYSFCKANSIIPLNENGDTSYVLSNPLDLSLLDSLGKVHDGKEVLRLKVAEPEGVLRFFERVQDFETTSSKTNGLSIEQKAAIAFQEEKRSTSPDQRIIDLSPNQKYYTIKDERLNQIIDLTNRILISAVKQRASDIHIEPKAQKAFVRYRIDGDLHEASIIQPETSRGIISRLKVLANMNIAETRRPQDGSIEATMDRKKLKMRLATVGTPFGESMIIRIFNPQASVISLTELGMNDGHIRKMKKIASSNRGMLVVVGPTGSGKTTTLYSLINTIDTQTRSLISIEDPIEYTIAYANQMEINERIGITFESLLKSAMRQDPDILFLGEVRDKYSAKMAVEAASTGHLTFSTLHTLNSTTAIFRLERLEVSRSALAEAILAVIAQRLVRKLCPHCSEKLMITKEESDILKDYTQDIPGKVGNPVGCLKCNNTGYYGRTGVYEILTIDAGVSDMIRRGLPIAEIRAHFFQCNEKLLFHHALEKIREGIISVEEAFAKVFSEENPADLLTISEEMPQPKKAAEKPPVSKDQEKNILVVDDDEDMRKLISLHLKKEGYHVTSADDGLDALMKIGKTPFNLILSDINMPNLDGMKLLEVLKQKGIESPVVFITSRSTAEDEIKGLSLGAIDYMKKPISKEILLFRVRRALQSSN